MKNIPVLLIDAVINLLLGVLLLAYSPGLVEFLGVPVSELAFYPNILGAVFIGITIALVVEHYRRQGRMVGSRLGGAVVINLSGGIVLMLWLAFGELNLQLRGVVFLWGLVVVLVGISMLEWVVFRREKK